METEMMGFVITAIGNFGFPIVVTSYLLLRFEKKIENLNASILELAKVISNEVNNENKRSV